MGFGFTAAEELRNVAEQEAVTMAEKEDQWEEQKTALNLEIESLRDRITSKADVGDSTEAFRAQIDSLKEENRQLQQSNRDRDREMADQRDRFENLASRVDTLTRERDALSEHVSLSDRKNKASDLMYKDYKKDSNNFLFESNLMIMGYNAFFNISNFLRITIFRKPNWKTQFESSIAGFRQKQRILEQNGRARN